MVRGMPPEKLSYLIEKHLSFWARVRRTRGWMGGWQMEMLKPGQPQGPHMNPEKTQKLPSPLPKSIQTRRPIVIVV